MVSVTIDISYTTLSNMLKFVLVAACAVQLAAAADPKISSTADGTLIAEDKSGKVRWSFMIAKIWLFCFLGMENRNPSSLAQRARVCVCGSRSFFMLLLFGQGAVRAGPRARRALPRPGSL